MFALEPSGPGAPPALATVAACEVVFAPERTQAGCTEALSHAVARVQKSCADSLDVGLVLPGNVGTVWEQSEDAALCRFGAARVDVREAVGECGGALGGMQVAAGLALGRPGSDALITGIDDSGAVAAAVLRIEGRA